jgi:hypothetical protein
MKVTWISSKGQCSLVEWDDGKRHRAYIPSDEILNGEVSSDTLAAGIPYGLGFEALDEDLSEAMHRTGIWTSEDVRKDTGKAITIAKAHGYSWVALMELMGGAK